MKSQLKIRFPPLFLKQVVLPGTADTPFNRIHLHFNRGRLVEIVWEHREITRVSGYAVTGYKSMEPRNRSKLDRFYTFS